MAGIVHDLRNPITAIFSSLVLIEQLMPPELMTKDMEEVLHSSKKNAENLASMVTNILDYSKLKSNKLELHIEPFSVKEFI